MSLLVLNIQHHEHEFTEHDLDIHDHALNLRNTLLLVRHHEHEIRDYALGIQNQDLLSRHHEPKLSELVLDIPDHVFVVVPSRARGPRPRTRSFHHALDIRDHALMVDDLEHG